MSAPLRLAPMPLAVLDESFDHADFILELKYDGFRALAHVDGACCRIISRNHREFRTHESPKTCPSDLEKTPLSVGENVGRQLEDGPPRITILTLDSLYVPVLRL